MNFNIEGNLHHIFDEERVSERFRKREFVLEVDDNGYTQYLKFQTTQDRCLLLDQYSVGSRVVVSFGLSGRPYNRPDGTTTYFTNLDAWKIVAPTDSPAPAPHNREAAAVPAQPAPPRNELDDLPF